MKDLYIKEVEGKGRCVFTSKDIKKGEIVEIAPVFVIKIAKIKQSDHHEYRINNLLIETKNTKIIPKEIDEYCFNWSALTNNGNNDKCIALGFGSLYSSANPSNMCYQADEKNLNIIFIAVEDIKKDTELTINYSGLNGSHESTDNYWFKNKNFIE